MFGTLSQFEPEFMPMVLSESILSEEFHSHNIVASLQATAEPLSGYANTSPTFYPQYLAPYRALSGSGTCVSGCDDSEREGRSDKSGLPKLGRSFKCLFPGVDRERPKSGMGTDDVEMVDQ